MRQFLLFPIALFVSLAAAAQPATAEWPQLPFVELSAEGSADAANDLATAQAYHETTGESPARVSAEVNRAIEAALATAKSHPEVEVRSAGVQTFPVRSRDGRNIDAWRMRSSLLMQTRDIEALTRLLGKLQGSLAVSSIELAPAPETRRAAEDKALVQAIGNFEARAALAAKTLGKRYRIRQLAIDANGARPPVAPMYRAALASAEAAPAPIAAGESALVVRVSGRIELLD